MPDSEQQLLVLALASKARLAALIETTAPQTIIDHEVKILEQRVTRLATILLTMPEVAESAQKRQDGLDAETPAGGLKDAPRASERPDDGCKIRHGLRAIMAWVAIIAGITALSLSDQWGPFAIPLLLMLGLISYMAARDVTAWADHWVTRRDQKKNDQLDDDQGD